MEKRKAIVTIVDKHPMLKGVFAVKVYRHINGEKVLIEDYEDNNLIVDKAREQMAHLVAGDTVTNRKIAKIAFGTGSTEATILDESITNSFVKNLEGFEYPVRTQVKFTWSLGIGEANGKAIREFGLLCADNALFARRVRASPINKESDISLEGSWTIIF